jgi:hypothetical protein
MHFFKQQLSIEWSFSDKAEEIKIYEAIMKLHPSLEAIATACVGHKQALRNLIHMVREYMLSGNVFSDNYSHSSKLSHTARETRIFLK